ncbi:MAG TPA: hypothetical protein VGX25_26195 [Actinophytocola sp.]|uniref:hypothetical protein n=1 Tax=Actinophytocola sp. TaxID=1872138 RepID=UPI002DDCE45F|nr:hypothetical protein [Actinophytocola sp.]HEV2782894.1 hypothetical protein [Actinophytocola sp.]
MMTSRTGACAKNHRSWVCNGIVSTSISRSSVPATGRARWRVPNGKPTLPCLLGPRDWSRRMPSRSHHRKNSSQPSQPITGELMPNSYWTGWPATHPVRTTAADAPAHCSVQITVAGGVAGTPVIRFGSAQLRRIPDPRPAWNAG